MSENKSFIGTARTKTIVPGEWLPGKTSCCAMICSFVGSQYNGLQIQACDGKDLVLNAVEEHIWKAFFLAGVPFRGRKTLEEIQLEKDNIPSHDFATCRYTRCSRTDKGVSAARFIFGLSFKMPTYDIVQEINKNLPDNIRIHGYERVSKTFNARKCAGSRIYHYLLPAYALKGSTKYNNHYEKYINTLKETNNKEWLDDEECFVRKGDEYDVDKFLRTLKRFEGNKTFHNYTRDFPYGKQQANRQIYSWDIIETVTIGKNDYLVLQVHGASFMMHQIRKMIGAAVAVTRGSIPPSVISCSFNKIRFNIPTAPGLFLYLDKVNYEMYNKRFSNEEQYLNFDAYDTVINEFKKNYIYTDIARQEEETDAFAYWLRTEIDYFQNDIFFEKPLKWYEEELERLEAIKNNTVKLCDVVSVDEVECLKTDCDDLSEE